MDHGIYQYYVEGGCEYNFLHSYMHAKKRDFLAVIHILEPVPKK